MTLHRKALHAALFVALPWAAAGVARAQPVDGLYVGAGAGYNLLQDITATLSPPPAGSGIQSGAPMKVTWGGGYALSGSVGWGFGNGARLELEGSYRDVGQSSGGGHESQVGAMANAFYDIDIGVPWVSPYIGVGVGYQAENWHAISGEVAGGAGPASVSVDGTQGGFAYQAIVGLAFPIEAVPGLAVTAEYRYMNMTGTRSFRAEAGGVATRAHVGTDGNHSFMLGLRYAFDMADTAPIEPPPPIIAAAPAPAPARAVELPARTYLVFFDWNSAALSPRAHEIIAEAVRTSAEVAYTRIDLTGHTDRTGPEEVNMALSVRRAQAVADEMERLGVPSAVIDVHGVGDTRPLVPTAEGVRQSENRRVEIVYR